MCVLPLKAAGWLKDDCIALFELNKTCHCDTCAAIKHELLQNRVCTNHAMKDLPTAQCAGSLCLVLKTVELFMSACRMCVCVCNVALS